MTSRSHVFVVRSGMILALRQAGGRGWWEHPGGDIEDGEDAGAAAVRETLEETGLRIDAPELLRGWSYTNARGETVHCFAYAAAAPDGDVRLSEEHAAHAWMTVDEYEQRYCSPQIDAVAAEFASFIAGMRENCRLLRDWLARQA